MFSIEDLESKYKFNKTKRFKADLKKKLYVDVKGRTYIYLGKNPEGDNFYLLTGNCITRVQGDFVVFLDGALVLDGERLSWYIEFVYANNLEEKFVICTGKKYAMACGSFSVRPALSPEAKNILDKLSNVYSSFEYRLENKTPTNPGQIYLIRDMKYKNKVTGEDLLYLGFQYLDAPVLCNGKPQNVHLFYKLPSEEKVKGTRDINAWLDRDISSCNVSAFCVDVPRKNLEYGDKLFSPTGINNYLLLSLTKYEDSEGYDDEDKEYEAV